MERKVVFTERENQLLNSYVSIIRKVEISEYSNEELKILSKKIDDYIEEERSFRASIGEVDEMWLLVYHGVKEAIIEKELYRREKGDFKNDFTFGISGGGKNLYPKE